MQLHVAQHACAYLPGKIARTEAFLSDPLSGEEYHDLMDQRFRRSGRMIYRPVCEGCRACQPLRVAVDEFVMSKSQRRVWRRNQDLTISIAAPSANEEKFALYQRFTVLRHGNPPSDFEAFCAFLYDSPVQTIEMSYRDAGEQLLAVGICDLSSRSLSSVYFYFDPDQHKRSLGTFSALVEINLARQRSIPWYYLGYWIAASKTMSYKSHFGPYELLDDASRWNRQ